jgi:Mrp family chromosome partitioning ATPase
MTSNSNVATNNKSQDVTITRTVRRIDSKPDLLSLFLPQEEQALALRVIDRYLMNHGVKRLVDTVARRGSELGFHSIGITSLRSGEGKTFFTAVLARGLALYLSARVLIVDANGLSSEAALLHAVTTNRRMFDDTYLAMGSTGSCTVASLSGSGNTPPSQSEFRCGELIRAVQEDYDIVLVDMQALTIDEVKGFDASVILQQLDAFMMVVPRRPAQPEEIASYSAQVNIIATPCIGFVTNDQQVSS